MSFVSDRENFSRWLQREREKRDWSQNELATRAGLARQIVNRIEAGQVEPAARTLQALATALGIPVQTLFRVVGYLPKDPSADPLIEEGIHILQQLEGEYKEEALRQLRMRMQLQEEHTKSGRRRERSSAPG